MSLFFLLFSPEVKAQWLLGVKAGGAYNAIYSPRAKGFTYNRGEWGYMMGVVGEYRLSNALALQAELSWAQKNYRNRHGPHYYLTYTNDYIELPLLIKYYFGKGRLKVFADLGGYFAYWISAGRRGMTLDILGSHKSGYVPVSEVYSFVDRKDQRLEVGLLGGLGLSYQIFPRHHVLVDSRYTFSLTDTEKGYLGKPMRKNNALTLSLGYRYEL